MNQEAAPLKHKTLTMMVPDRGFPDSTVSTQCTCLPATWPMTACTMALVQLASVGFCLLTLS